VKDKQVKRIAIIGAGGHSCEQHGPAFKALKHRLEASAIVDLDLKKAQDYAATFELEYAFNDIDDMIQYFKPDALIAITPTTLTAKIIRQLLPYGLPILAEKPFGDTIELSQALCAEVKAANAKIMLSFNRRFSPVCTRALQITKERFADRPMQHIRGTMLRKSRHEPVFLTGTGVHLIDTMNMFAGCAFEQVHTLPMHKAVKDHAAIHGQIVYQGDVTADLLIHSHCGRVSETYELFGPDYHIIADVNEGLKVYDANKLVIDEPYPVDMPRPEKDGAIAEFAYFLDCLEAEQYDFSPNPQDALYAAMIGDQLERENLKR
jgi:predicted dehydrogenase